MAQSKALSSQARRACGISAVSTHRHESPARSSACVIRLRSPSSSSVIRTLSAFGIMVGSPASWQFYDAPVAVYQRGEIEKIMASLVLDDVSGDVELIGRHHILIALGGGQNERDGTPKLNVITKCFYELDTVHPRHVQID